MFTIVLVGIWVTDLKHISPYNSFAWYSSFSCYIELLKFWCLQSKSKIFCSSIALTNKFWIMIFLFTKLSLHGITERQEALYKNSSFSKVLSFDMLFTLKDTVYVYHEFMIFRCISIIRLSIYLWICFYHRFYNKKMMNFLEMTFFF